MVWAGKLAINGGFSGASKLPKHFSVYRCSPLTFLKHLRCWGITFLWR